jgi:hypothetical protein
MYNGIIFISIKCFSLKKLIDFDRFIVFNATFSNIMATSFSGGRSRSTRREPLTMGKQLVNFITCDRVECTFICNLQSQMQTHAVLVIGLYELLGKSNYPTH